MNTTVLLVSPVDRKQQAKLTNEHSSSSYGLPVLVVNGEALGPGELLPGSYISTSNILAAEGARAAGYTVKND